MTLNLTIFSRSDHRDIGRIAGPVTCDDEEGTRLETNDDIETNDGTVDCSSLFIENTSVGRGKGNGIPRPNGRVNNIQSAEDCRAECAKVDGCNFFIWNSPDARRKKLSCWLKKNDNNRRSNNKDIGRISGPVSC